MTEGTLKALTRTLERVMAQERARVEHPFHAVKNLFLRTKIRYKGLAKYNAQLYRFFGLANLVWVKNRLIGMHAVGISAF